MSMPEKIGRYEIVSELGQGGMAVVYLAHDPLMGRQVALKLLPSQLTFNESMRERFQREARIVASLEHPAIVPVHDFGEFNEQPFLVMRYMVGGSLAQHTRGERQALPEVVRILSPLSHALDKAHSQHIIHRDLKPDNILFDGDENPYLSDFGIARLTEGTQTTSIMGTPAYMSPEQITGDVELDGRSDIYALGVILFEMLSGEQPYTADTPTQVMMKHVLEPVPMILDRVSDLPPVTQLIIERAMAKDREDRYRTAEDLLQAVKELLTASQAAEVGAAIAATMLQETMLEMPEPESDPLQTVVETPHSTSSTDEIKREVQALPFKPAVDALEPDKKDSPSRGRQIVLLGCAVGILIFLCILALGVFGYFAGLEDDTESMTGSGDSRTAGAAFFPATEVNVPVSPTPVVEEAATQAPDPAPTALEPTVEPLEFAPPEILFSDNFDGKSSIGNWDLWQDESAEFTISSGQLIAIGLDKDTVNWVKQIDRYTDLEVTVSADILQGGSSAFFGVVFADDGGNYVGCFVQGDNSAYCGESLDGETEFGDWVIVDLSLLKENDILFVVSEEEWAMAVNGKCVGSGFVDFGPQGQPALAVSTDEDELIASIAYEDFLIRSPTAEGLSYLHCEAEQFE